MISLVQDVTANFNGAGQYNFDVSNWDYVVIQIVTPSAAVTFSSTNDSNAATGGTDGSPRSATNWVAILGTNLNTGTTATSTALTNSLFKFNVVGRYMQIAGPTAAATVVKALIYFTKIS